MFGLLVTFAFTTSGVLSLKLREVSVPAVVIRGQSVQLGCNFDLEGNEKLYSVKWHKDNVEFFRYLPDYLPPAQKYDLEGTTYLELHKSSKDYVYMSKTDVHSEGIYRCEVSTDAPSFQTVKGEGEMRIYVFPSERPQILGNKPSYEVGDEVSVTCYSAPSRPATFLRWLINGKEAPVDFLVRHDPEETYDGLMLSRLGLRFIAKDFHFVEDGVAMALQCEAIISQAHTLTSEEILVSQNVSSSVDRILTDPQSDKGPTITKGKLSNRIGDEVDINCTAPKSQRPAELHWYINDKEVRSEHLVRHNVIRYTDGLESSVLGLRFTIKQRYFPKGQPMRIRCTAAALSEVTRMSSPVVRILKSEQKQQMSGLHVFEKSLAISNSSWKTQKSANSIWTFLALALTATFTL